MEEEKRLRGGGPIKEGDYVVLLCSPRAKGYVQVVRDGKFEREVELWEIPDHGKVIVGERNVRRTKPPLDRLVERMRQEGKNFPH